MIFIILSLRGTHKKMNGDNEEETDDAVESEFRLRTREHPGCFDRMLVNRRGVAYVQAMHGDNPVAAGFTFATPLPSSGDKPSSSWAGLALAALIVAAVLVGYSIGRLS